MSEKIPLEALKSNLSEAIRVIMANKVRTFLTALGIIFGVAAVITMLAIGKGAEQEILAQLELVGVNNIVITTIPDEEDENQSTTEEDGALKTKRFSKGLDLLDVTSIQQIIPTVKKTSPEIIMETFVINKGKQSPVKLIGVTRAFFTTANVHIDQGQNFTNRQNYKALPVCIIGGKVAKKLFAGENALGKFIKVRDVWLKVVGIIEEKLISETAQENLGIRDLNQDIYIPIKTFLVRYRDRKIIVDEPMDLGNSGFIVVGGNTGPKKKLARGNYHQIDKLVVQVDKSDALKVTAEVIGRMLQRRHNGMLDFEISIPINLLKQQQKTKQIFNIVLSIIAGISLLIGGIGIMNIMLASILERTKEIGIMKAIGATKRDIVLQFLAESVLISLSGGVIGSVLGIMASYVLEIATDIRTIVSIGSILLSFLVATFIGLAFGVLPARSAANKNPIEAIRH